MLGDDGTATFVTKKRYKLCPACGNFAEFSQDQVFCILCGQRLLEECPTCSEPIVYPTARFCQVCGTALVKRAPLGVE